jgi:hypothetical protein
MGDGRRDDELRAWLRAGDPLRRDAGLLPEQSANLRRRILRERSEPALVRPLALAAASAAVVVLTAVLLLYQPRRPSSVPPSVSKESGSSVSAKRPETRRIQFTTENGTRIFWTLDPDFEL